MSYQKLEKIDTEIFCCGGCGNKAEFLSPSSNKYYCRESANKCPANREKNSKSRIKNHKENPSVYDYKERYKKLPEETKEKMAWSRGKYSADFSFGGKGSHKKVLLEERGQICESCNLTTWLGLPITLELEHIDGDGKNNNKTNLLLICPNCHSQTKTWKGKNISSKKQYVSDEELLEALKTTPNIRQALTKVNLTPKGGNYHRAYDLLYGGLVKLANTSVSNADA